MDNYGDENKLTHLVFFIVGAVIVILFLMGLNMFIRSQSKNEPYAPLWYIPDTRRTRALRRYRRLRRWDYPYYKKILDNDPSLFFYDMGHYPF